MDRIPLETVIALITGKWKNELDSISVTIHFFNSLAFAYRSKTDQDLVNELVLEIPPIRRVVRKTTSTFWFFREILHYGEDCLIISPDSVRTHFQNKLIRLFKNYQL